MSCLRTVDFISSVLCRYILSQSYKLKGALSSLVLSAQVKLYLWPFRRLSPTVIMQYSFKHLTISVPVHALYHLRLRHHLAAAT